MRLRLLFWILVCAALLSLSLAFLFSTLPAKANEKQAWLLSWIPAACCVTNQCCWEITESELQPLPNDEWRVKSTGQVVKRTNYSPDGKFYRCACDREANKWWGWVRHQGATTRCIFTPMRLF
jgi:hypothetical protein